MRVLVVAAHPDDETYGMGGTIVDHVSRGHEVHVLILADGVSARHNKVQQQEAAASEACRRLGVRAVKFGRLPDQRLDGLALVDVIRPIEEVMRDLKPQVLYTHHRGDANQDHRTVFAATLVAARPFGDIGLRRFLCYEVASSTEWGPPFTEWTFTPNVFVDITKTLDRKVAALEPYADTFISEVKPFPHPRSPEAVRLYAQQRGVTVGLAAAEAFALVRELV